MNKGEMKYCKFCDKEKPIEEFCKSGFAIKNICRECNKKKQKQIYSNSKIVEQLQQENINLKQALNEIRELLGQYKHYYLPDENQNSENEDLVEKSYAIIDKVLGDDE